MLETTLLNMMADLDKVLFGVFVFDEFIFLMTAQLSDTDSREDLRMVYNLFLGDDAGSRVNNKIQLQHLKRVARELNEAMSDEELMEMITRADLDRDGAVDFE